MSVKLKTKKNLLPKLSNALQKGASTVTHQGAASLKDHAKSNIQEMGAVDTGELYESVEDEVTGELSAKTKVGAAHGRVVNDGTSRMPARPYWDQALETTRGEFVDDAGKLLRGLAE